MTNMQRLGLLLIVSGLGLILGVVALMLSAEHDVGYIAEGVPVIVAGLRAKGCDARRIQVPGRDHWYAAEAMTDAGVTVQQALRAALREWTCR